MKGSFVSRTFLVFQLGFVVLVLTGCSDILLAPDREPASIELLPDTLVITDGEVEQLDVRVLNESGNPIQEVPDWSAPQWDVFSDGVLSVEGEGLAEASRPGETSVQATVAGHRTSNTVLVNPRELSVAAVAYITQATQGTQGGVPLVAGRPGLVRLLMVGDTVNFFQASPTVTLYTPTSGTHTLELQRPGRGVPTDIERGRLVQSWNAAIPRELLEPGTEMVVRIDPDNRMPLRPGSVTRLPEDGREELHISRVPDFRLLYVPIRLRQTGTVGQLDPSDPRVFSRLIYDQFPLDRMQVGVRGTPWVSDADISSREGWSRLLQELWLLRSQDGLDAYYYGLVGSRGSGIAGLGYIGFPASVGLDDSPGTAAHEIGHNVSLLHAPCGGVESSDPDYPHANGAIGEYGYSLSQDTVFSEHTRALMSYCFPRWISRYNYLRAWRFRVEHEGSRSSLSVASSQEDSVLAVWGTVGPDGAHLAPAFRLEGPAVRPDSSGPYVLKGRDERGRALFSVSFAGREVDHIDGKRHFLVRLPLDQRTYRQLHSIELRAPGGIAVRHRRPEPPGGAIAARAPATGDSVRWSTERYEAALLRDPQTGDLVGMDRDGSFAFERGPVEVILSDGVHSYRETVR